MVLSISMDRHSHTFSSSSFSFPPKVFRKFSTFSIVAIGIGEDNVNCGKGSLSSVCVPLLSRLPSSSFSASMSSFISNSSEAAASRDRVMIPSPSEEVRGEEGDDVYKQLLKRNMLMAEEEREEETD
jgi:hypothetical protein